MCAASQKLGIHRPRTKYLDVEKANLTYRKQRKHTKSQTRKITRRLLDLLGKILKKTRKMERILLLTTGGYALIDGIKKLCPELHRKLLARV